VVSSQKQVLIIPCSGIGKPLGSVAREAANQVIEDLRPDVTSTVCLSLLTMGDPEAMARVRTCSTITIDGCAKACALKNVQSAGVEPAADLQVVDTYREHRELKVSEVIDIGEPGQKLARHLADKVVQEVDRITGEGS
jgi:uncharacterized metal-binding protein